MLQAAYCFLVAGMHLFRSRRMALVVLYASAHCGCWSLWAWFAMQVGPAPQTVLSKSRQKATGLTHFLVTHDDCVPL